jgi:hypothetical protein
LTSLFKEPFLLQLSHRAEIDKVIKLAVWTLAGSMARNSSGNDEVAARFLHGLRLLSKAVCENV